MPTPRGSETRSDFVKRCIPVVIGDRAASGPEQAVAICHSIYDQKKKKGEKIMGHKMNQRSASMELKNPVRLQTNGGRQGSNRDMGELPSESEIRNAPLPPGFNPNRTHEQNLDDILPVD